MFAQSHTHTHSTTRTASGRRYDKLTRYSVICYASAIRQMYNILLSIGSIRMYVYIDLILAMVIAIVCLLFLFGRNTLVQFYLHCGFD